MGTYRLAVILKNPSNDSEFLLVKEKRPPKFEDEEYDSYVDSDLWDLPSTQLNLLEGESKSQVVVEFVDSHMEEINLRKLDFGSSLNQVFGQLGFGIVDGVGWKFWKYVKEAEFGPGLPIQTVFITRNLEAENQILPDKCKWMSVQSCLDWLLEVKRSGDRVGPMVVVGLVNDSAHSVKWKVPPTICYQEYPPSVVLIPMESRTGKPFRTTNLVVFAPSNVSNDLESDSCVTYGDALIVDPGCRPESYEELKNIVTALPRKLVVFVTHHHRDHVDGLKIVQKCNPDATLLAHENTMLRIGRDDWSLGYTLISGGEEFCISGERLAVIFAPGHTDGHMALLHIKTHSLIVGDHCVGQGSSVLDITSGGNMTDYFQSTYKFLDLSPHAIIPMHGRVNLWPKQMLCGYLKNRRSREASILKAIEDGARTLFDIVANVYSEVDRSFWIPAASNVRLHVDHLAKQHKLPKEFSIQKFQNTCGLHFLFQWSWAYLSSGFQLGKSQFLIAGAVAGFAVLYWVKHKLSN